LLSGDVLAGLPAVVKRTLITRFQAQIAHHGGILQTLYRVGIPFEGGKHAAEPTEYSLNFGGHETEGEHTQKNEPGHFRSAQPGCSTG
jgi:hypothetical protein